MDQDFEPTPDSSESFESSREGRNKTSLRLKYEAETRVFRSKFGGLEDVRRRLNLSRRQMSQLLLVDPSAWTRWTRDEERVPPHIYRALEWYLTLEGRSELHPQLSKIYLGSIKASDHRIEELVYEISDLKRQLNRSKRLFLAVSGLLGLGFLLVLALHR
jgi:hypothetical protein